MNLEFDQMMILIDESKKKKLYINNCLFLKIILNLHFFPIFIIKLDTYFLNFLLKKKFIILTVEIG